MNLSVKSLSSTVSYKLNTKSVWDLPENAPKSKWMSAVLETSKQYCFNSVLHGVKYLAEPRRSYFERFSWSLVLSSLVAVVLYLCWITSFSDLSSPMLINLESSNHPIWNFSFPAVTICPSKKLNRAESEAWASRMKLPPNMSKSDLVSILPSILHLIDFADSPEVHQLNSVLEMNNVSAYELYINLSVPCKDLLVHCRLRGVSIPCQQLFKTIRTTEGYCCSFNYFGVSSQFYLNRYHEPSHITPQVPMRFSSIGQNSGISVVLRTKGDSYGTLMSSQGVKVLLHVATNYPDHLAIERLVQTGHAEHLALHPTLVAGGNDIRDVSPDTRACYFFDEIELPGFQQYSYKSCIFNCRAQFFVDLCGCVPFYIPSHPDGTRTCSLKDVPCLTQFKYQIQTLRLNLSVELSQQETAPCGCKPQCNELSYSVATSTYPLINDLKTSQYGSLSDFKEYSEVNVYFRALFGTRYQRVQHLTTYQSLANFGGLLGLFMGFSFIAAFEVIYCFTLRVLFRVHLTSPSQTEADVQYDTSIQAYE